MQLGRQGVVCDRGRLLARTPFDRLLAKALCATSFGSWAEVVIHHPMPLFHMEHCPFAASLSSGHDHRTCGRPCEKYVVNLRDRVGMDHPVEADVGCRNTVVRAEAQSAAAVVSALVETACDASLEVVCSLSKRPVKWLARVPTVSMPTWSSSARTRSRFSAASIRSVWWCR